MTTTLQKKLITAREAEAYIPPLEKFAGNYRLKEKLLGWLRRPVEHDPNLLIEGEPGTGKTTRDRQPCWSPSVRHQRTAPLAS